MGDALPVSVRLDEIGVLRGHHHAAGDSFVVLVHDEGGDIDDWRLLVPLLVHDGHSVVCLDLPGHGLSDGAWDPAVAPAAVGAALDQAAEKGARRVALVGAGVGAAAALVAAGDRSVDGIVALSPRAAPPALAGEALREARVPKLFVCGGLDEDAAVEAREFFRRSIGNKLLVPFPVEAQGAALLEGMWGVNTIEQILAFLHAHLAA